jgi:hypothetical protein
MGELHAVSSQLNPIRYNFRPVSFRVKQYDTQKHVELKTEIGSLLKIKLANLISQLGLT